MNGKNDDSQIFIVITQTGTVLSRILKIITKAQYNHVSISLDSGLSEMYSFGRKFSYFPFWGGFVKESVKWGTFKRFSNTKAVVLSLDIDYDKYNEMLSFLEFMQQNKRKFHYNYMGLVLAAFKWHVQPENCFYCSEFVKYILQKYEIKGIELIDKIPQPIHFLRLPTAKEIYRGKLKDFVLEFEKIT